MYSWLSYKLACKVLQRAVKSKDLAMTDTNEAIKKPFGVSEGFRFIIS
jgi:hypothetical protein